ncbi:hypothetical protein J3L14_18760 [Burkholderia pseudomallei]|uniref:hypothetical protein n=1 Tax=Burkholderia pseudomallei TaxID=28450 RepID=UPI001293988E|nr:hypothetical protein [Burkholderia pseudomallei]QTB82595.1 hypothetical protein J3L14_18760 [Burkholderia pseudomallei]
MYLDMVRSISSCGCGVMGGGAHASVVLGAYRSCGTRRRASGARRGFSARRPGRPGRLAPPIVHDSLAAFRAGGARRPRAKHERAACSPRWPAGAPRSRIAPPRSGKAAACAIRVAESSTSGRVRCRRDRWCGWRIDAAAHFRNRTNSAQNARRISF